MILPLLIAVLSWANVAAPPTPTGRIQGVVLNGTRDNEPIGNVEVLLRAGPDGALEPMAQTHTDTYGKYSFDGVPLDPAITYLPGADRGGVHYPGNRVRLDADNRFAHVAIVAFDATQSPSPLIALRHEIDVDVQQDVIEISESLLVANPSRTTYVGKPVDDQPPVTLRLSIPRNFDRVTFGSEFYGRRFRIVEHQPVTDAPWPPGERELKFTYRVPRESSSGLFRRTLDVPSRNVTLRVRGKNSSDVSCDLPLIHEDREQTTFASANDTLDAGHIVELQIGTLPFPWMQYTRWGSLLALAALTLATVIALRRRDNIATSAEPSG